MICAVGRKGASLQWTELIWGMWADDGMPPRQGETPELRGTIESFHLGTPSFLFNSEDFYTIKV